MAYKGGVPVNSGFYPRNDFPIANAKDIYVSDEQRLDANLQSTAAEIAALKALIGETAVVELLEEYIKNILITGSTISYIKGDGTSERFNTTFVGTRAEYEAAYAANKIPVGTIVVITDEPDDDTANVGASSSILGTGVLGYMILG
jgi:hypothetical protein